MPPGDRAKRTSSVVPWARKPLEPSSFHDNRAAGNARQHNGHIYYNYTLRQRRSDESLRKSGRNTAFLKAVEEGQLSRARYLLQLGADLDFRNDAHQNALHIAVKAGLTDIVRFLLEAGADVNCTFMVKAFEWTILTLACVHGFPDIVDLLLKFGAAVNGLGTDAPTPLCVACTQDVPEIVQMLLKRRASLSKWSVLPLDIDEMTSIPGLPHEDSESSFEERNVMRCLPLHVAITADELDLTRTFLEKRPNLAHSAAQFWSLDEATWKSRSKFLERVAQTPDATYPCLHLTISHGSDDMPPLLLQYSVDINGQNDGGETALHTAAEDNDSAEMIPQLIQRGARLDIRDKEGLFPWQIALQNDAEICLCAFLDHGVNISTRDESHPGYSLLHSAAFYGSIDCAKTLVQRGIHIDCPMNADDGDTTTPLHVAIYKGESKMVKQLVGQGASTKKLDSFGRRALHIAALYGKRHLVDSLLEHGADLSARDSWGMTAASYAAWEGHLPCLSHLMDKGATLDIKKIYQGRTLLTNAVYAGHGAIIRKLLDVGADPWKEDRSGWTAIELAQRLGDADIIDMIKKRGVDPFAREGSRPHGESKPPVRIASHPEENINGRRTVEAVYIGPSRAPVPATKSNVRT